MSTRICIGGRIGAGKTSVANLLGIPRYGFVQSIRQEIRDAFGVTMEDLTTPGLKERYRALLVAWGPARNVSTGDDQYWAKRLLERIEPGSDAIVDDLRRTLEFDHIRAQPEPDNWIMVWLDVSRERCRDYLIKCGVTDEQQLEETLNAVTEINLLPYVEQGKFDIVVDANRPPTEIYDDLVEQLLLLGVPLEPRNG